MKTAAEDRMRMKKARWSGDKANKLEPGELERWIIYGVGREAGPTASRGVRVVRRNELASLSATI